MRMDERPAWAMSAHPVGVDLLGRDVGRGVVAVRDHRLQHPARPGRAGEIQEHRAAGIAHAVIDCQRLVIGEQACLDVAQVLAEHEGLVCAGREEKEVRLLCDPTRRPARTNMQQVAFRPWQRHEPLESRIEIAVSLRATAVRDRDPGHPGRGKHRRCEWNEYSASHDSPPS